jgi:predicted dehydrogenase
MKSDPNLHRASSAAPSSTPGATAESNTGSASALSPWPHAPLRVGLVGGGLWARVVHADFLAAGPETKLAGVWARRPEAAAEIAAAHGCPAFDAYDDLLAACDAVAFAVPPDIQAALALKAVAVGKAVLLEKPIALDLAAAEALAAAVREAKVGSLVLLTWRYAPRTQAFLDRVREMKALGGEARFITAASLGGPFATPWRLERGPLLDLGPHVIDMLEAALGPVTRIRAAGDLSTWVSLQLDHQGGAVSTASLSAMVPGEPNAAGIEVYGREGTERLDTNNMARRSTLAQVRRAFAEAALGVPSKMRLDVQHGLHLQRLLHDAESQLR